MGIARTEVEETTFVRIRIRDIDQRIILIIELGDPHVVQSDRRSATYIRSWMRKCLKDILIVSSHRLLRRSLALVDQRVGIARENVREEARRRSRMMMMIDERSVRTIDRRKIKMIFISF